MNFVLVFPLILGFLSSGHSYVTVTEETRNSCYKKCQPGYYKTGECSDPSDSEAKFKCGKCRPNTFTNVENYTPMCERCGWCGYYERTIKPCTFNSDVVCDCIEGYYDANHNSSINIKNCKWCNNAHVSGNRVLINNPDYIRKCMKPCQRSECSTTVPATSPTTVVPPATTTSTTTLATFMNATATATRSRPLITHDPVMIPLPPNDSPISWIVWLAVMFAVVFGLLLLKNLFRDPECCTYWRTKKDVKQHTENPKFNEQHSHQDNASTTLMLNVCEETPMMTLSQSPSTPEHPAPITVLLPNTEHRAARQDEHSNWPAIVLYAIIKEVPLRRWKEFLRLLSVADEQLERVEMEAGLGPGSMERQYQMLRLWSQRSSASLDDVFSALHYMELSRCAQLLQENLENLQWRAESKQGFTA